MLLKIKTQRNVYK